MPLVTVLLILASVALSTGSQVILKFGMTQPQMQEALASGDKFTIALAIATSPLVILGFASFGVGAVVWLFVLSRAPLSSAYPFVAFGVIATVALGATMFGETVSYVTLGGAGLIATGILLVAAGT